MRGNLLDVLAEARAQQVEGGFVSFFAGHGEEAGVDAEGAAVAGAQGGDVGVPGGAEGG